MSVNSSSSSLKKAEVLERRESTRVEARLVLELQGDAGGEEVVTAESINLSAKGLYCTSTVFLSPLTKVSVNIIVPPFGRKRKYRVLRADGMVVRCEPRRAAGKEEDSYNLACYFTSLTKSDHRLLSEYVDWKLVRGAIEAQPV